MKPLTPDIPSLLYTDGRKDSRPFYQQSDSSYPLGSEVKGFLMRAVRMGVRVNQGNQNNEKLKCFVEI